MTAWRFVVCTALVATVAAVAGCKVRPPTAAGPVAAADWALTVKDITDLFDQPVHSDVPLLCDVLNADPASKNVVGSLKASTRNISSITERSPFSIPFIIDDALEDARHAECHWSLLATPDRMKVSVEVTSYQAPPATKYARAAFAKLINESKSEKTLTYQRASLGSAACISGAEKTYYGVLRKDNVLMAVSIYAQSPVASDWPSTVSSSPVHAVMSVLDERFGGAPEQSPDEHDDCK